MQLSDQHRMDSLADFTPTQQTWSFTARKRWIYWKHSSLSINSLKDDNHQPLALWSQWSAASTTHPSVTSIDDLYRWDRLHIFSGQIIRPVKKNMMIVEGRRMKTRRTVTSEKRMLGAEGEEEEVRSLVWKHTNYMTGDLRQSFFMFVNSFTVLQFYSPWHNVMFGDYTNQICHISVISTH